MSIQSFVNDPLTTASIKETFLPRFSRDSEAFASEFLENLEMFPQYMYSENLWNAQNFSPSSAHPSFLMDNTIWCG